MIVRFCSQQDFDAFWQITEGYLDQLCGLQTALKLERTNTELLLHMQSLAPAQLFDFLVLVSEICSRYLLNNWSAQLLERALLLASKKQQYGWKLNLVDTIESRQKLLTLQRIASQEWRSSLQILDAEFEEKTSLGILEYWLELENLSQDVVRERLLLYLEQPQILQAEAGEHLKNLVFDPQGYFAFRLSYLQPLIEKSVLSAITKELESTEYRQLVATLRNFLQTQKPVTPVLNVLLYQGGSFSLLDEKGLVIREQEIINELELAKELGCGYDDTLATAIISLAPQKIVLHQLPPDAETNQAEGDPFRVSAMLEDLLGEDICYCQGCKLCSQAPGQGVPDLAKKIQPKPTDIALTSGLK